MAIVYLSSQVKSSVMAESLSPGVQTVTFSIAVPAAGFANGDSIVLAQLPLNATLLDFYFSHPALDTNVSPTLTWEVGDATTVAKYVASTCTDPRAAGERHVNAMNAYVAGSLPATYTAQGTAPSGITVTPSQGVANWLIVTFTAVNATAATTGTVKGYVTYTLNTAS